MIILGSIIQAAEIVGISHLAAIKEGNNFYYTFSVITRSSKIDFTSSVIEDVHIATKNEQIELSEFKRKYEGIRDQIGLLLGEEAMIIAYYKDGIAEKMQNEFTGLCQAADKISKLLSKSKIKDKEEVVTLLGTMYANAKKMIEITM